MLPSWHQDLESLEAISQDDVTDPEFLLAVEDYLSRTEILH